mmetsp:Transcript_99894/g.242959  ORF Transcript_99894/g.242959 Transcript_99894/m.242959 type:complete len:92 (-) Transcript_99894:106-381(-)
MSAGMARTEALSLYRNLLRQARVFKDYNFREYALRRTRDGFRAHQSLAPGSEEAQRALAEGRAQLDIVKRQSVINAMYAQAPSVMEQQRLG